MNFGLGHISAARRPIPRGIKLTGPAILSYGFRPFFLGAGVFALCAMGLWMGALVLDWPIGGTYGALSWHAHEMLFGYVSAALAGFMLTAVPNWTGRLPVSGWPLLGIATLWFLGRLLMAAPDWLGLPISVLIDSAFLPVLATVAGIEIVAGNNWKNLKILVALVALSLANIGFHVSVAIGGQAAEMARVGVSIYIMLIAVVGGRIIPSFTRNWLVKGGSARLPKPFGRYDAVALAGLLAALMAWVVAPSGPLTAVLAAGAATLHGLRLIRWSGHLTLREPLLVALHAGYGFLVLGMFAVALAAFGTIAQVSAVHVLTVGALGNMTLAVMTRASLGHTGRKLIASGATALSYIAIGLAALLRPIAELVPEHYHLLIAASALCWMAAFALFVSEYGPILVRTHRSG